MNTSTDARLIGRADGSVAIVIDGKTIELGSPLLISLEQYIHHESINISSLSGGYHEFITQAQPPRITLELMLCDAITMTESENAQSMSVLELLQLVQQKVKQR